MMASIHRHPTGFQLAMAAGVVLLGGMTIADSQMLRDASRWWRMAYASVFTKYEGCRCEDCQNVFLLGEQIHLNTMPLFICRCGRRSTESFTTCIAMPGSLACFAAVFAFPRIAAHQHLEQALQAHRCPVCGYSKEGLRTARCPECGGDLSL